MSGRRITSRRVGYVGGLPCPLRPLVSTSSLTVSVARPRDPGRAYAPHTRVRRAAHPLPRLLAKPSLRAPTPSLEGCSDVLLSTRANAGESQPQRLAYP